MPWWSVLRDGLRRPRADSRAVPDQPSVQRYPAAESQPAPFVRPAVDQAWRDLPTLQRTLAEPIEPAAPLDLFTGSLTAHQNPSFLAPLGHRVDPGAGGLVDGLADFTPGHPISYRAADELPVPTAAKAAPKLAVQRTLAEWPTRSVSWPGADTDPYVVDTVPMERPVVDVFAESGSVVTGRGTNEAPLALTVSPPSPVASQPSVQRHAVGSAAVPEEPVEDAGGMEAIQGLTVSRLAESTVLAHPQTQHGSAALAGSSASGGGSESEADVPTLGRKGNDPLTGPAGLPSSGPTGAAAEAPGHAHPEPGAKPEEGPVTASRRALPIAPVQRQPAQTADLGVRRTWPVVPEQSVRAAAFPALPIVELPVARSVEPGVSTATQNPVTAPDLELTGPSADSAATSGADPSDAPLSGFAAAISALHAGDGADAPVQRVADPGVDGLDGPPMQQRLRAAGAEGSGSTVAGAPVGLPVQRLAVGPGEFLQAGQAEFEEAESSPDGSGSGGSIVPAFGGNAPDAPTLGTGRRSDDLPGEAKSREGSGPPEVFEVAGSPSAGVTSGYASETTAASPEVVDGQPVNDELPELPVVAPDHPAAPRGSVAMPVVGSAPVQRSVADPSGWTPVRTAGLLASRVPTLQLKQLSSATPLPPPVQRVTFLADAASTGAVAQRLPATATTSGPGPDRQRGSAGVGSAGPAVQSVAALQRTVGSTTSSSHIASTAMGAPGSVAASRPDRFSGDESEAFGDSVRWDSVPLEQADDDESAVSAVDGIGDPAVVQRAVEFPAGPAAGPIGDIGEHSGSWAPADSDVVALDAYAAVRQVEPPVPPRRPATVMPPMPIIQRHVAAETAPPQAHRSSSAGISFTSIFAAASEAAESGYTTVQLQADDSAHSADAAEPESAPMAPAAGLSVQRESEPPPPSAPAPGGAPAGGAPAGADLDEMARRLFEPLSARLRAEFWLDRERAGLMTDARP